MNIVANFEHGASSSRGKHEGESSFALCDRLSRTRDNSQRQLPTDHDYAVPTREYQTDQSSLNLPRLLLALSSRKSKGNYKNIPTDFAKLTRSLHIRAYHSSKLSKQTRDRSFDAQASVIEYWSDYCFECAEILLHASIQPQYRCHSEQ